MTYLLNILVPFFFFFFIYLGIQIVKITLYAIYIVQLKEYRWDRLKAHFRTVSGKREIIFYFNLLKWRQFYRPQLTLRALLIFGLTLIFQYNFFFIILRFLVRLFRNSSFAFSLLFLLVLILINLVTPFFVFLAAFLSQWLVWPIKNIIYELAAKKINQRRNLKVIGITGSYGKTATKEILAFTLEGFFKVLKTPLNCNTHLGIAKFIWRKLAKEHRVLVVEIGAYKKGEIEAIAQMVKPQIGIITGINEQHQELFGSLKNTQWAKNELIQVLSKKGLAIFNAQNKYTRQLYKFCKKRKVYFGQKPLRLKLKLLGDWYQEAVAATLAVTDYLKLPRRKVFKRLAQLRDFPLAINQKKGMKKTTIFDDAYSANPTGFLVALDLLQQSGRGRKILITPGIIELGAAAEEIHQRIAKKAIKFCHKIFLTKADFYEYFKIALTKNQQKKLFLIEDPVELLEKLSRDLNPQTKILLEGRVPAYLRKHLLQK